VIAQLRFMQIPALEIVAKWLDGRDNPIRQRPSSFSVDQIVEKMMPKAG
jgi:hypothetical protein